MYSEYECIARNVAEIVDDMPDLLNLKVSYSYNLNTVHTLKKLTKLVILQCCVLGFEFESLNELQRLRLLKIMAVKRLKLTPLRLESLTKLYIYDCYINDLSNFSDLFNLRLLSIKKCKLNCIKHSVNMVNLNNIDISGNNVDDIVSLRDIESLVKINIDNNPVKLNFEMKSAIELLDMGMTPKIMSSIVNYKRSEIIDEMKAIIILRNIKSAC
jgi:hypothetical protein